MIAAPHGLASQFASLSRLSTLAPARLACHSSADGAHPSSDSSALTTAPSERHGERPARPFLSSRLDGDRAPSLLASGCGFSPLSDSRLLFPLSHSYRRCHVLALPRSLQRERLPREVRRAS